MGRASVLCVALVISVTPWAGDAARRAERAERFAVTGPAAPPPLAPIDGHRYRRADGIELRFDAALGAYVVPDAPAVYFFAGVFARLHDGLWQTSGSLHGPWRPLRTEWIPLALRAKHYAQERLGADDAD